MSPVVSLAAGANQPLDGMSIAIEFSASSLGGARIVADDAGTLRALEMRDAIASVELRGGEGRAEVDLSAVPPSVSRLRLFVWSEAPTRVLAPARACVKVGGNARFEVEIAGRTSLIRSAEVVELYRRHGSWKLRSIASGWEGHLAAMAQAVGLPEAAFAVRTAPLPPRPARPAPDAPPPPRRSAHNGPSPPVGPMPLRALVDSIVGPGPRNGTDVFLGFELADVQVGFAYFVNEGIVQLVAEVPLGSGNANDAIAEAALRATGASPCSRVCLPADGSARVTAVAMLRAHQIDSSAMKALLSDAWVTAARFRELVSPLGWSITDAISADPPRELRLGVAEELQAVEEWRGVRDRLVLNDCLPLADQPAAVLATRSAGQLSIGPTLLAGTTRAWAIVVEQVLRSDITLRAGMWRAVAEFNQPMSFVRFGLVNEPGRQGPPVVMASFAALQIPRTQVMEDLQIGLEIVDRAVADVNGRVSNLMPAARWDRKDLPWPSGRRWTGPGSELATQPLVRELETLLGTQPPPAGFIERVQRQRRSVPEAAYLAHLALQRAETTHSQQAWIAVAQALVHMAPIQVRPGEPCATASLHARLRRVMTPPARPQPTPSPAPRGRPTPSQPPAPKQAPAQPPQPGTRRRWRIFG